MRISILDPCKDRDLDPWTLATSSTWGLPDLRSWVVGGYSSHVKKETVMVRDNPIGEVADTVSAAC